MRRRRTQGLSSNFLRRSALVQPLEQSTPNIKQRVKRSNAMYLER